MSYTFFFRPEGKVPCLALGDVSKSEIIGLGFQQVDRGTVRPVMMDDEFLPVQWPNAPRPNPRRYINLQNHPGGHPIWHQFIDFMTDLRVILLQQVNDAIKKTSVYALVLISFIVK